MRKKNCSLSNNEHCVGKDLKVIITLDKDKCYRKNVSELYWVNSIFRQKLMYFIFIEQKKTVLYPASKM